MKKNWPLWTRLTSKQTQRLTALMLSFEVVMANGLAEQCLLAETEQHYYPIGWLPDDCGLLSTVHPALF